MRAEELFPEHLERLHIQGINVRKGTVAAFIGNARTLLDPAANARARAIAEADIVEALPALRAVGLLDVMEIRDASLRAFVDSH